MNAKQRVLFVAGELVILVILALMVMAASAHALQATTASSQESPQLPLPGLPPMKLGGSWLAGLLMGLVAGVQATFVGMLKNRDKLTGQLPKLDIKLAAKTLAVGLVVGLAAYLIKWSPSDMASWFVTAPIGGVITAGVEDLVDLVWRKLSPPKAGPQDPPPTGA